MNIEKVKNIIQKLKNKNITGLSSSIILKLCDYSITRSNQIILTRLLKEAGYIKKHTRKGKKWYL